MLVALLSASLLRVAARVAAEEGLEPAAPANASAGAEAEEATAVKTTEAEATASARPTKARYDYRAFIDAFGSVNYNRPRRHSGANIAHGNDWSTGFGLVWAGLDVSGDYGPVGGTLGVRLGPVTELYNGADTSYGLQYLKQAYATFRPIPRSDRLAIDFGKMDTLYGAEVADSQDNLNYTRGALVWIEQPFFHTGLRIRYRALRWLEVAALAVNGWNNTLDNNRGKSFGIQETITALDGDLEVAVGYLTGPEGDDVVSVACPMDSTYDGAVGCAPAQGSAASTTDVAVEGVNRRWRHFADLVIRYRPHRRVLLLVNADFMRDRLIVDPITGATRPGMMYGVMAAASVRFTERWSAAARGELVDDVYNTWTRALSSDAAIDRLRLITGTVTLRYQPVPQLAVMLDNRVDSANHPIFGLRGVNDAANLQVTSTLGVIVMTR